MKAYASRTGTKRNLSALRAAGWSLLVSARGVLRHEGFGYALDNGAWTAFQREEPFDIAAFEKALRELGQGADWIVLPDIMMGGVTSLDMSLSWLRRLRRRKALRDKVFLIAVQNGMEDSKVMRRIARWLGGGVGIFVGGDTHWKLATMAIWARLAHSRGEHHDKHRHHTERSISGKKLYGHPTVKPEGLMNKIMANVQGQTVCDPFMGTGSTGVAAIRAGKTFTGIEHNPTHFETAISRISAAYEKGRS